MIDESTAPLLEGRLKPGDVITGGQMVPKGEDQQELQKKTGSGVTG